jgi:hypothetical protein
MAIELKKKISLIATAVIICVAGFGAYYLLSLKKGPYRASSFVSIDYKWGVGDTLVNHYQSATGDYQYLDNKDSLIKTKVKFNANNVIFLHSKADELGLWSLPNVIANSKEDLKSNKILRYEITFTYEEKVKKVIFVTNYSQDLAIAATASKLQQLVAQTISDAEARTANP